MTDPQPTVQQVFRPSRARQRLVTGLVVLGSVLAFFSVFAIWVERQALNTDDWVGTSGRLLQNATIRQAVANYLVDQLYANVNVRKEVGTVLPAQVKQLAGPASAGLRQVAGTGADQILDTTTAQQLWEDANRNAHEQLLAVLNGGNGTVSTHGGTVTLNLGSLVNSLVDQVGIGPQVSLPASAGRITILHSDQLSTAQDVAKAIRGLAVLLVLLTLATFAAAIYLSAPGGRWLTVLYCGAGFVAAGFAVLVARHVIGQIVVDQLVTLPAVKGAANSAWSIGTSLMVSIATTVIVLGLFFVVAGWLGSPASSAHSTRRLLAPALQLHVGYLYAALGIVAGIYFLLAPTQGLRSFLTVLALTAMAAVGIDRLRRQTAVEFPGETPGPAIDRARDQVQEAVRAVGRGIDRLRPPEGPSGGNGAPSASPADARIERLERLAALKEKGVLTDEELAAEKSRVLSADSADE